MSRRAEEPSVRRGKARPARDAQEWGQFFDAAGEETDFVCADLDHGRFLVNTEDGRSGRAMFATGVDDEVNVLTRSISTLRVLYGDDAVVGRTLLDVGAGFGSTPVAAVVSHLFASVVAIEPDPDRHLALRLNMVLNAVEDRVLVVPPDGAAALDSLADVGVLDPPTVGLARVCTAQGPAAVLETATVLLDRRVPVLTRLPADHLLVNLASAHYTHVAKMGPDMHTTGTRYELEPVSELDRTGDGREGLTHVLLLHLSDDQVPSVRLGALLRRELVRTPHSPPGGPRG